MADEKYLRFLDFPAEIRDQVYDILVEREDDLYQDKLPPVGTAGRGVPTPATKREAADFFLNHLLVNRQISGEFQAVWCRAHHFAFTAYDTITRPHTTLVDARRERSILDNAKSYKIQGHVGGWPGRDPQYSVHIDLLQLHTAGYRPTWQHLTDQLRTWFQITDTRYQRMVHRVEAAIQATVASCMNGLTWPGTNNIIAAFHLSNLVGDDGDSSDSSDSESDDDDDDAGVWLPDDGDNESDDDGGDDGSGQGGPKPGRRKGSAGQSKNTMAGFQVW